MKKLFFIAFTLSFLFGSDAITIDSLFKRQIGLRSITSLSLITSGNANIYTSYPSLIIGGDPVIWTDNKRLSLNETLIYSFNNKLDFIASFGANATRNEYSNFFTGEPKSENHYSFESLWLGFNYRFNSFDDKILSFSYQAGLIQREKALDVNKSFYFKSHSAKLNLRGYSDPAIWGIYMGFTYNDTRAFDKLAINYGNSYNFGANLSIILSPKISLDLEASQSFQTAQKINGIKYTNLRSIPTYSIGSTYSINDDTSVSFNASLGGGSAAPDSVFNISLWQKF